MNMYSPVTHEVISHLAQLVGDENISTRQSDLDLHAQGQSAHEAHAPEVILWVENVEHLSRVLAYANENRIPVTAWGAGTSLEGNPIALYGGILVSFEHMNKIIAIHADDFQVTVQPGLGYKDLNIQLGRHGLFFALDPGANASIGGRLANNAAGIHMVKYGATKDNVLRMQVVLVDGRLVDAGSRSVKQSSGYDLAQLFIGSEGTLGLLTEATLKLVPIPGHISTAVACLESVDDVIQAVVAVRSSGTEPAALEFLDAFSVGSISDIESRAALIRETAALLKLEHVKLPEKHVIIDRTLANYNVNLGSGVVHKQPGGSLCIIPVHSQHRGRIFLPFTDNDPKIAEIVSKVILLARDEHIKDPTILKQIH